MKVHIYAGDMNLNRKDKKKVCRNTTICFLGNETVKTFFLVQTFYNPMGYLASIMFECPANISMVYRGTSNVQRFISKILICFNRYLQYYSVLLIRRGNRDNLGIIFPFFNKNVCFDPSLEPSQPDSFNMGSQHMVTRRF